MLDVDRRDHVDAGFEYLEDVLPALGVAPRSGDIRVRQLVDEHDLGMAFENGVEVHLLEGRPPVLDGDERDRLEADGQLHRVGTTVRLDEADDHVGATTVSAISLVQHGEGLPDPGRGAEVDAEVTGGFDDAGQVVVCRRGGQVVTHLVNRSIGVPVATRLTEEASGDSRSQASRSPAASQPTHRSFASASFSCSTSM